MKSVAMLISSQFLAIYSQHVLIRHSLYVEMPQIHITGNINATSPNIFSKVKYNLNLTTQSQSPNTHYEGS